MMKKMFQKLATLIHFMMTGDGNDQKTRNSKFKNKQLWL